MRNSAFTWRTPTRACWCLPPDGADEARRAAAERNIPDPHRGNRALPERCGFPEAAGTASAPRSSADDVALILHTSGTTGRPKRVPLQHLNLALSARNIVNTYQLSPDDVSLCLMPLFHVHGLVASTLSTLLSGGTVVVPARFNPLSFWRTVRDSRRHLVFGRAHDPSAHAGARRARRPNPAARSRCASSGPAARRLPSKLAKKLEALFGAPVLEAYGMTEASHQMASNPLPPQARKFGTVGPATGIQIGIMNEAGDLLAAGRQGRSGDPGPERDSGLRKQSRGQRQIVRQRLVPHRRSGRSRCRGLSAADRTPQGDDQSRRRKDCAARDRRSAAHASSCVREAVCFGVPHPTWGEEVAAAVVLREPATEAELIAYCRERLADFKCPKKIYIVESIPRTATGKVQR